MKPSILVVMLDFLVCSLLMFVVGSGGQQSRFASSAPAAAVAPEFSPAALQVQQDEWNRDYEQQSLLAQLGTQTAEADQLRVRLQQTSTTLADREANLQALTAEKARVEQARAQTAQALATVEGQLTRVSAERARLQQEGDAAKKQLAGLQVELTGLQAEQAKLQQEKAELHQRAEQLGGTVASQQATITTLTDEVRASQTRVETQLADVARGQQAMGTTLAELDAFTRTLPAAIQKTAAATHDEQQTLQQNLAALADNVRELQAGLNAEERAHLMQAVTDVAQGQRDLRSRLDTLIEAGPGAQVGESLDQIAAGQEALRQQTARLGDQIESIKSRGPGPFKAVKEARLEWRTAIARRDAADGTLVRFRAATYPPVIRVDGKSYVIANVQTLGLTWWGLGSDYDRGKITQLEYTASRTGEPAWSSAVTTPACVLRADPRVVVVELDQPGPGLTAMELAPSGATLQSDQRKLHVFKSTAAGLSFEAEMSPDLADLQYLVVKRALRGVAAWFENPAYRAGVGDYVVTPDGKLVGIMVSRDQCFVISKEMLGDCALTVPLADPEQFLRAARELPSKR